DLFVEAVNAFLDGFSAAQEQPLVLIPAAQAIEPAQIEHAFRSQMPRIEVKVVKGQSHICMKAARAALIKSGTSTLEAALLQVPMVLAYQSSRSTEWVYRHIVRYRGFVGLVNLFLEPDASAALGMRDTLPRPVVPEMILKRCRPELIAEELRKI